MSKWKHSNIYIYFNDIFGTLGENCLPYMPENFTCNLVGKNEEIDILHGVGSEESLAGTMNFVKRPGLKTWSIECFFNHPEKPMYEAVRRGSRWTPQFWVDFFESAMYEQKVLEMTVTGLDIVNYVTVESFKHTKEAGEELDTYYTIDIKEYQFQEIKEEEVNIKQEIPKYDGNAVGGQKETKPNINSNAWFIGVPYKQLVGVELKYPYTWIFTNGSKNVEGLAYLDYMPVKVIEKVTKTKQSDMMSGLGNYIREFSKNGANTALIPFFTNALMTAWETRADLHNWFNHKIPTQQDFNTNGALLQNAFRKYCIKHYSSQGVPESALQLIISQVWKTMFAKGNKENWLTFFKEYKKETGEYTYYYNTNVSVEFCLCETQQEFGVNTGSSSALSVNIRTGYNTGVEYFPKGTKIWGFAKQQTNNPITSYVTNENRGNIPFTIKGINKQGDNFSYSEMK